MELGAGGIGRESTGAAVNAQVHLRNYRIGKTLGIASFGKVKLARHELTGHKVAIKILNRLEIREAGADMEERIRREIKITRLFMHPHIIRLYEVVETPTDIFAVMEYVEGGELLDYVIERLRLKEDEARRLFQQIVGGVEYCHRHMVVHRDLKPENVLLDSNGNVKIIDFGLSNVMRDGHFLKTSCGSPNYAAPELINQKKYAGPEVDVWSCGVILYSLLCGFLPFDDENIPGLYDKIRSGIYTLPSHLSPGARDLISRMLLLDPVERATVKEIREHPWFEAHLPRYLAVPPLLSHQLAKEIDDDVLQAAARLGFEENELVESLHNWVQNEATVAYYLVLDNYNRRNCWNDDYLREEFRAWESLEGQMGFNVDQLKPPIPREEEAGRSPGRRNCNRVGLKSNERKWAVGMESRAEPTEIMMEILYTLIDLQISWKKVGSYCLRCRWVPPLPGSRAHSIANSEPYSESSPMISRSFEERAFVGNIDKAWNYAYSEDSPGKEGEYNAVKLEVQLYKVKEEKYLLDLQRIDGPHMMFLDLCASFLTGLRNPLNICFG